jgi:hypothetical protein
MNELKDKPKAKNSESEKELDRVEKQFDEFDANVKKMSLDRMNESSKLETEPQTKLSQIDIEKSKEIYLKPIRTISSKEKFNEKFRDDYNFSKEYVYFVAEHKELIGETIELWTKPYPGMPAEEWKVPTNVPIWGPRYLAEQIKNAKYHRFQMKQKVATSADHMGEYYGAMCVDTTVQRLDAMPASRKKSIFMGSTF